MARFEIQFNSPLVSADVANENCIASVTSIADIASGTITRTDTPNPQAPVHEPPVQEPPAQTVASCTAETIGSIRSELKRAVAELASQQAFLQSTAACYAVEVARVFLGSTNELIEQRLQQNVLRVLQHPDSIIVKLYVHPSCGDSIKQWLDENDLQVPDLGIDVLQDEALLPGDCRVDFGRSGRLASLEEQLKLVESRLRESINNSRSGESA